MDSSQATPFLPPQLPAAPMALFGPNSSFRSTHPLNYMICAIPGLIFGFGFGLYYHRNCRVDVEPTLYRLQRTVQEMQSKVESIVSSIRPPKPNEAGLKLDQQRRNLRKFLQEKLNDNNRIELLIMNLNEKIAGLSSSPMAFTESDGESNGNGRSSGMLPSEEVLQNEFRKKKIQYVGLVREYKKLQNMTDIRIGLADMISSPDQLMVAPQDLDLDLSGLSRQLFGLVRDFKKAGQLVDASTMDDEHLDEFVDDSDTCWATKPTSRKEEWDTWKSELNYLRHLLDIRHQLHTGLSCKTVMVSY